ncbi:MAG: DUF3185 family protein [Balneolaceae bacterium]
MVHKKLVSLLFLFLGVTLFTLGYREILLLSTYLSPLVTLTPDTETKVLLIFGAAASISGFVGLIRDKTIDI